MKKILQIAAGIVLAFFILGAGCSALVAGSADEVNTEINKTLDRYDDQERVYFACAEELDIEDPHYLTKLDECSNGLYR